MTRPPTLSIVVNGRPLTLASPLTIGQLLEHLELTGRVAAVERNGEALSASERTGVALADGDRIELVKTTAGG